MNKPARRNYFRSIKTVKRVLKTVSLSFVFLLILLGSTLSSFAQSSQYSDYADLFNGYQPAKKLKILKKVDTVPGSSTTVATKLQMQFTASFPITEDEDKEWHWDHVTNFLGGGGSSTSANVFIMRICDTGVANEGSCRFSVVPHTSSMAQDSALYCTGTGANRTCKIPDQRTESVPKIYHYTAKVVTFAGQTLEADVQNDKFNVVFSTASASTLGNAELNAPVNLDTFMKVGDQKNYKADIWYCAQKYDDDPLPTTEANDGIRFFNNICGSNRPYFKIAETDTFQMPADAATALAEAQGTAQPDQVNTSPTISTMPNCHILNGAGPGEGSFVGCIAWLVYYGIYSPIKWFAGILGMLFDFFIGYSLSDSSYRAEFAVRGWQIVRDMSNIFFIIILVWTGLATVFGVGKVSMKQVIPNLILNALLINFSLFATRVVIDLSNIVARVFYNSVHVCDGDCLPRDAEGNIPNLKKGLGSEGYTPLSEKIVSSFNPQKIFSTNILNGQNAQKVGNNLSEGNITNDDSDKDNPLNRNDYATYYVIVSLIGAAILFSVAMMFWKTAFFFLGRVIGLYLAMIFAPFAFLSRNNMPLVSGIKALSWDKWADDLVRYAMLAPIFVFFLYIVYTLIESDFMKFTFSQDSGGSFLETVLWVSIPMLIVYKMIEQGVKIAETYAGELGKMVQGYAQKATGILGGAALGVASGGLAFAGTRVAGLAKMSEATRASMMERKAQGGIGGRIASLRLGLNDKAQSGSFDFRKTNAFNKVGDLTGKMGVSLNDKVSKLVGLGEDKTKGGIKAIEKKEKEDVKKKIESLKTDMKDEEAAEFWKKKVAKMAEEEATKKREAELVAAGKSKKEIQEMKKTGTFRDASFVSHINEAQKNIKENYGPVENNKQLTQAVRAQYAQTISEGRTFGQQVGKMAYVVGSSNIIAATGLGSLPVIGAVGYDQSRKNSAEKKEAKKYFDDKKKDRAKNKLPKEDRLDKEKGVIEKELESIDETLKKIFAEEIRTNPAHAGKTVDHFFTNAADGNEAIRKARQSMRNDLDALDIEVDHFKDEYLKAMKSGDVSAISAAKTDMINKISERNIKKHEYEQTAPERKQKLENDRNKKEDELEKIKEKKENKDKETK